MNTRGWRVAGFDQFPHLMRIRVRARQSTLECPENVHAKHALKSLYASNANNGHNPPPATLSTLSCDLDHTTKYGHQQWALRREHSSGTAKPAGHRAVGRALCTLRDPHKQTSARWDKYADKKKAPA